MSVYNKLVARAFQRIAQLLQVRGDDGFKIRAYQRAADTLRHWPEDVRQAWRENRLTELPHIGPALAKKIDELLRTGRLSYLERLEAEVPPGLLDLLPLPGLGPGRVRALWQQGITNRDALAQALAQGTLPKIKGLGAKGLARLQAALVEPATAAPLRLDAARTLAQALVEVLLEPLAADRAAAAGAVRRWEAAIDRVTVLAAASVPPEPQALAGQPFVARVEPAGPGTWQVHTALDWPARVLWTPPEAWGAAWLAATGPQAHWEGLQTRAAALGLRLQPTGLTDAQGRPLPAATEEQVYAALGLPWLPPCARHWPIPLDRPDLWEAALADLLPWDAPHTAELHAHTTWSDGKLSVRALAQAALARGLRVLAITDHSQSLKVAGGLSIDDLRRQREEIRAAQADVGSGLRLLQGAEVDILPDGSLDYPDEVLAELDVVVASPHQALDQGPAEATRRLVRAASHPRVHILGHPTGRMIPRRAGLPVDLDAVARAAAAHGVALEINANPHRLDLDGEAARRALVLGARLAVNTDAHRAAELDYWPYGLATARRAGARAAQVLNAWPAEGLLAFLRRTDAARREG